MNTGYITNSEIEGVMKLPIKNAVVSISTPARIVFLLPILDAMIPTGI